MSICSTARSKGVPNAAADISAIGRPRHGKIPLAISLQRTQPLQTSPVGSGTRGALPEGRRFNARRFRRARPDYGQLAARPRSRCHASRSAPAKSEKKRPRSRGPGRHKLNLVTRKSSEVTPCVIKPPPPIRTTPIRKTRNARGSPTARRCCPVLTAARRGFGGPRTSSRRTSPISGARTTPARRSGRSFAAPA